MRLVDRSGPGAVGLNWMWLPTWIGMNALLVREIENAVADSVVGKDLTEETLQYAHEQVMNFLLSKFPEIEGLFEYLDGLKYVANG